MAAHSYDTTHSIEPEILDADLTPSDLAFALEHLTFNRNGLSTLRLDRGVRDYIVRQCAAADSSPSTAGREEGGSRRGV
jgi:hypothetical protein